MPATCLGCPASLPPDDPGCRLCPACSEQQYETLARALDPGYDPAQLHEWEECEGVLRRLYGRPNDPWTPADCRCKCRLCAGQGGQ